MSERYHVSAVPTFVIVDSIEERNWQETSGFAMPAARLATFYNESQAQGRRATLAPVEEVRRTRQHRGSPEPKGPSRRPKPELPRRLRWSIPSLGRQSSGSRCTSPAAICGASARARSSIARPMSRSSSPVPISSGSKGTQQPSPQNFKVPITVDLFNGQLIGRTKSGHGRARAEQDVVGEAIDYDFDQRRRPDPDQAGPEAGRSSRVVPPWWNARSRE